MKRVSCANGALRGLIAGLCGIGFGVTACALPSRLERSGGIPHDRQPLIIDIMPRYWQFRDATRGADSATTVRLFHDIVVGEDSVVYKDFTGGPSDATIASFLAKVGPYEPAMRIVHERIRSELPRYIRRFGEVLPDARWDSITFYIMPWLFISNGGGGPSSTGGQVMIFGVDAVARDQGANGDLAPLFYHELFHLYHSRIQSLAFPELERLPRSRTPLWQLLWREGLATYAASRLTPSSSMDAIVGDSLAERVKPHLAEFSRDLRSQLDSTSAPTFRLYFTGMARGPGLPPARSGYYIGMLVAERLGQTRSLPELARLGGPQLRSLIEQELRKLEYRQTDQAPAPREEPPDSREVLIEGAPFKVVLSQTGVRITEKGRRKGLEVSWDRLLVLGQPPEASRPTIADEAKVPEAVVADVARDVKAANKALARAVETLARSGDIPAALLASVEPDPVHGRIREQDDWFIDRC